MIAQALDAVIQAWTFASFAIVFVVGMAFPLVGLITVYGVIGHLLKWWPDPIVERRLRDIEARSK